MSGLGFELKFDSARPLSRTVGGQITVLRRVSHFCCGCTWLDIMAETY